MKSIRYFILMVTLKFLFICFVFGQENSKPSLNETIIWLNVTANELIREAEIKEESFFRADYTSVSINGSNINFILTKRIIYKNEGYLNYTVTKVVLPARKIISFLIYEQKLGSRIYYELAILTATDSDIIFEEKKYEDGVLVSSKKISQNVFVLGATYNDVLFEDKVSLERIKSALKHFAELNGAQVEEGQSTTF